MIHPNQTITSKAMQLRALFLDVDGVLTDGTFYLTEDAKEIKRFHTQDGVGLKALQKFGFTLAVISGRNSQAVTHRMQELNIIHVYQGIESKKEVFNTLLQKLSLLPEQVAYMGDDLPDLELIQLAGVGIAPNNAVTTIKKSADWITRATGGHGAVREVCDFLINLHKGPPPQ